MAIIPFTRRRSEVESLRTEMHALEERLRVEENQRRQVQRLSQVYSRSQISTQKTSIFGGGGLNDALVLYQAYMQCPWISAPIDLIARRMTSGGFEIVPTRPHADPKNRDRLLDFFLYCNDEQDFIEIAVQVITSRFIFGAGLAEIVSAGNEPLQLYSADPVTLRPEFDVYGRVHRYVQRLSDGSRVVIEPDSILWLPIRGARGETLSPIQKLLGSTVTYNYMIRWSAKFFQNGARPSGNMDLGEDSTPEDADRQRDYFDENYSGVENAHSVLFTYGGGKYTPFVGNSVDMSWLNGLRYVREEFIAVMGIEPVEIGVADNGARLADNGISADKRFRMNTVEPAKRQFEEKIYWRIINQGFGIDDWRLELREGDYRSDDLISKIVIEKVAAGLWTRDFANKKIGDDVELGPGGKVASITLSRGVIPVSDLPDLHSADYLATQQAAALGVNGQSGVSGVQQQSLDNTGMTTDAEADLTRWQRKAIEEVKRGLKPKPFQSEHISLEIAAGLALQLESATSPDAVRSIFDSAFEAVRTKDTGAQIMADGLDAVMKSVWKQR